MRYVFTFCLLLFSNLSFCQQKNNLKERNISFSAGRSKHGTGDIRGLIFNTEYSRNLKQKLSWIVGVGGTIHDGVIPNFFTSPNGTEIDGSIRYTTAGVQATNQIGYSFINTNENQLELKAGALLRYQSSSFYDDVTIYYPAATGLPIPVILFVNQTPQKSFAVGGCAQIFYTYSITPKIIIGALAGLQTDTNGDTITQLSLSIGRRF
jgi:hypothetical protein